MDTLLPYPEDYSDAQLRPCLAMFTKSKTYLTLIAAAFLASNATPSFAVERGDSWDWNSGTREEESQPRGGSAKPESDLDYEPDQAASQLSEDDRPESAEADRPEPSQPRKSRQTEEPSMSVNVAEPANRSRVSTKTLVAGEDWRTGDRQTAAQAAIEKNPGIEKDCDGKVLSGDDSDAKQAEVDSEGNVTSAGLAEIKANGKAYCQENPNESQCKPDKDGDVG